MTEEELEAIWRRCELATVGPWYPGVNTLGEHNVYSADCADITPAFARTKLGRSMEEADAIFVAAARTDVALLIGEVRRLREIISRDAEFHRQVIEVLESSRSFILEGPNKKKLTEGFRECLRELEKIG